MTPQIIGIAGGTGSGKTTVATKLVQALPQAQAALIQHDWYYRDRSLLSEAERACVNFDEPVALENDLLIGHLRALRSGQTISCPQYDFASHTRRSDQQCIEPKPIVIVEGILIFAVPELIDCFDLRLFVDTDDDIRLMRRISRDITDRGRDIGSISDQYVGSVRPMHQLHVAPSRKHAHLIIPEGGENAQALDVIIGRLKYMLSAAAALIGTHERERSL